jgi:hypothetical protein
VDASVATGWVEERDGSLLVRVGSPFTCILDRDKLSTLEREMADAAAGVHRRTESRLRKSAQDDKWSFCLRAGTLCPANQEKQ